MHDSTPYDCMTPERVTESSARVTESSARVTESAVPSPLSHSQQPQPSTSNAISEASLLHTLNMETEELSESLEAQESERKRKSLTKKTKTKRQSVTTKDYAPGAF